jgi:hypothetical protein
MFKFREINLEHDRSNLADGEDLLQDHCPHLHLMQVRTPYETIALCEHEQYNVRLGY